MRYCPKCKGEPEGVNREHGTCEECRECQEFLVAFCHACKASWGISEEENTKNKLAERRRLEEGYLEERKRKRNRDGTWKMTRWMELFELWLLHHFRRKLFWKWVHFRYKFMR